MTLARKIHSLVYLLLACSVTSCNSKVSDKIIVSQSEKTDSLKIEFSINNKESVFSVSKEDQTYTGLYPIGWASLMPPNSKLDKDLCKKEIQKNLSGLITQKPDVSFNDFSLAIIGEDSIGIVDPQVSLKRTKLKKIFEFKDKITKYSYDKSYSTIYVLSGNSVYVLDEKLKKEKILELKNKPSDLFLTEKNIFLLFNNKIKKYDKASKNEILSIKKEKNINITAGADGLLITKNGFATLYPDDGNDFEVRGFGSLENGLFLESAGSFALKSDDGVSFLNKKRPNEALFSSALSPELQKNKVSFFEDVENKVLYVFSDKSTVIDLISTVSFIKIGSIKNIQYPVDIAKTNEFIYIKEKDTNDFIIYKRYDGKTKIEDLSTVRIQSGTFLFGEKGKTFFSAVPEDGAMFISNSKDKSIYYYKEGLMAPIGSNRTYGIDPIGLFLFRSFLKEKSPGAYASSAEFPKNGKYLVSFLLKEQKSYGCFVKEITSVTNEYKEKTKVSLAPAFNLEQKIPPKKVTELLFKPSSSFSEDVIVYGNFYRIPTGERFVIKGIKKGEFYSFSVNLPLSGHYSLIFSSESEDFNEMIPFSLKFF